MTATILETKTSNEPTPNLAGVDSQQQSDQPPAYDQAPTPGLTRKPTMGERLHKLSSMAGRPLNRAANVVGAEGWWPDSVEKESVKAARILYSFTNLDVAHPPKTNGPMHPTGLTRKSMVKIPPQVLKNCAGLAIFNTIRAGAWHGSLSGGSGVVVARRSDGTWSPPSSFVVSSLGAGLMFGLDVYDCVCVLNSQAQVDAFTNPRLALGGNASLAVGPVGGGAALNAAISKSGRPMWSYIKSRGLFAGVSIDGTVLMSRNDANGVFYNERGITARTILMGDVAWPAAGKPLFEVLKALEGRTDVDQALVEEVGSAPPPGDITPGPDEMPPTPPDYVNVEYRDFGEEKGQLQDLERRNAEDSKSDIYESSVADEKERLAKSGY